MSVSSTECSIKSHDERCPPKSKINCFWFIISFFLGAATIVIISFIAPIGKEKYRNLPLPPKTSTWNRSDYLSNSDYYKHLSDTHDFTQMDNLRLDRLSSPRFHPTNGKSVMYLRKQYHMPDLKGSTTTLHWVDIETNKTIQLTKPIWGVNDQQFYWINDKTVLFLSNRGSSGLDQVFQLNLPDDISAIVSPIDPVQITDYPLDIDNLLVNRQATRLAFSCQVYANLSIKETADRQAAEKASGSLVYKFDKLFIRQWNEYMLGPRHHPFVVSIQQNANGIFNFIGTPRDVLFGIDSDSPIRLKRDGRTQWSFSASGNRFAFTRLYDEKSEVAWSMNSDIFTVDLTVSDSKPICITESNLAIDADPRYSPTEENVLVYLAQAVPGHANDQIKIKVYNGSAITTLLDSWDRSIQAITWSSDGHLLFLELGEEARNVIYKFSNILSRTSIPKRLISTGTSHDVNIHPTNNDIFVYTHESITEPANIYLYSSPTSMRPITDHNKNLMKKIRISTAVESFNFTGAQNETVWGWHVAPANGTTEKVPLVFLIHGGPQSGYYDEWIYYSNFQIFTSQGYAVIAINFHGSDSYGQKFADSIIGRYGTLPFEDLQLGLTAALNLYPYIDGNRAVAIGSSYGGYMINWIAGHPEMSQRFKTLINDAGLFNLKEMAYSMDVLFFIEYAVGGFTPYENPGAFEKFNPVNHVINWTQPMLIIHGGHDYRVPDTQGISAFTAAQRRGIPSRMLYLPTEGHSTNNPLNSIRLHQEILDWMAIWVK